MTTPAQMDRAATPDPAAFEHARDILRRYLLTIAAAPWRSRAAGFETAVEERNPDRGDERAQGGDEQGRNAEDPECDEAAAEGDDDRGVEAFFAARVVHFPRQRSYSRPAAAPSGAARCNETGADAPAARRAPRGLPQLEAVTGPTERVFEAVDAQVSKASGASFAPLPPGTEMRRPAAIVGLHLAVG